MRGQGERSSQIRSAGGPAVRPTGPVQSDRRRRSPRRREARRSRSSTCRSSRPSSLWVVGPEPTCDVRPARPPGAGNTAEHHRVAASPGPPTPRPREAPPRQESPARTDLPSSSAYPSPVPQRDAPSAAAGPSSFRLQRAAARSPMDRSCRTSSPTLSTVGSSLVSFTITAGRRTARTCLRQP